MRKVTITLRESDDGVITITPPPAATMTDRQGKIWTLNADNTKRYSMRNLGGGSAKYGPCEICHENVDSTYLLTQQNAYDDPEDGKQWTYHRAPVSKFGHKDCLLSQVIK